MHSFLWSRPQIQSESDWVLLHQSINHVAIAPVGILELTSRSCSMQDSLLGKTIDDFSPLVTCVAPSSTINANQKEGSFQFTSSLISLCSATKIWLQQQSLTTYFW